MPRGRTAGTINRTPGIQTSTIVKVRDTENKLDRSTVNAVIEFNDENGNRFRQVLPITVSKKGTSVYTPKSAAAELISEAPVVEEPQANEPETDSTDEETPENDEEETSDEEDTE